MRTAPGLVYQEGFGIKRRGRRVVNGVLAFSVSVFFFFGVLLIRWERASRLASPSRASPPAHQ